MAWKTAASRISTFDSDYTGDDPIVEARQWRVRESRTLEMERAVFAKLGGGTGTGRSFNEIEDVLKTFNQTREASKGGGANDFENKIKILQTKLNEWSLKDRSGEFIDLTNDRSGGYNEEKAKKNRNKNLCDNGVRLKPSDYLGTMLPTENTPC